MPIYEYECSEPEHGKFDKLQPIFGDHTATCPKCDGVARRVFSPPSIRIAEPITLCQELRNGQGYAVLDRKQTIEKTAPPGYRYDNTNLVEV